MDGGLSLETAMKQSLDELDGVFTYLVVTEDSLGVAKDEMAAKPLVLYESPELVALASEEVAIRAVIGHEIDTYDPYEREVLVWQRRGSTTTPAGWPSPSRRPPGGHCRTRRERPVAVFDAAELTTRQINLELRRLVYDEGVAEVTIRNPGAKHSLAVGILARCRITIEGSLGYFGCGLIDGPEIHITGRVGWSVAENMMSGVVVIDKNSGSLDRRRAARRRRGGRAASGAPRASTRRAARSSWAGTPAR